ncbi:alpha-ketoglutarate-dependent dioxygenase AlkB family protein [Simiduia agarivorans]|uniref:alpha-ketoglutarate-dependent dioxygenase AlkB family protein n=1 Tax=Simiduia agarivorans TaxID=447471 RepID=UPI00028B0F7F|nr:alpha-ketoglutarate-dependent dioxygenase AlkB [Simiduia agarivorans]
MSSLLNQAFTPEPLLLGGHRLLYQADYLKPEAADWLLAYCKGLPWVQSRIRLYGKWHPIPRLNCWFADPGLRYAYSGASLAGNGWTEPLARVRQALQQHVQLDFNNMLANYYRDGNDSMGWHSDDEPELGADPVIAAVSLGVERPIRFRPKGGGKSVGLAMAHGSLLVMPAGFQAEWQHGLPKRQGSGERVSLTFRYIAPQ